MNSIKSIESIKSNRVKRIDNKNKLNIIDKIK